MGKTWVQLGLLIAGLTVGLSTPGVAAAEDSAAFDEVLSILKRGGMVDEAGAEKIKALYAAEQSKKNVPDWLEDFQLKADFRARYDGTFYREDALGNKRPHGR